MAPRRAQEQAARQTEKIEGRIAAAEARGDHKTAAFLQRTLLASSVGKIAAVTETLRKRRHRRGSPIAHPKRVEMALSLDMARAPDEDVRLYPKRKTDTQFRPIHVFGVRNHARQKLLIRALEPRLSLDATRQFAWYGGRPAAISVAINHINCGGARWAIEVDIKSFFQNIIRGWVIARLQELGVPEDVIRATVFPDESHIRCEGYGLNRSLWRPLSRYPLLAQAGLGVPQGGACSSLIAEIIVSEILSALPLSIGVVNYADNFLLLARTRRELEQALQDLQCATRRHQAGRFELQVGPIRRVADGFDFLGYHLHHYKGEAFAEPSKDSLREAATEIVKRTRDLMRQRPNARRRLSSYCSGWSSAFSLWPRATQNVTSALFWGMIRSGPAAVARREDIMSCAP